MEQGAPGVLSPQARMQALRAGLRGSLYRRLLLLFLGLLFVPLMLLFVALGYFTQQQATDQVRGQLESVSALQRAQIDQWIAERQRTMQILVAQPGLVDSARTMLTAAPDSDAYLTARLDLRMRLEAARKADPEYFAFVLAIVPDSTVLFATSAEYDGLLLSHKQFFQKAAELGDYVQLPGFDLPEASGDPLLHRGQPFMAASTAVKDANGKVLGVLAGLIESQNLGTTILENIRGLNDGRAYLFDSQGRLLAASRAATAGAGAPDDPQIALIRKADPNTGDHPVIAGSRYTNFNREDVYGHGEWYTYYSVKATDPARQRPSDTGLALFVEQPANVALAWVQRLQWLLGGATVIGLAVLIIGGLMTARSVVRPVRALTETAVSIASGNLDQSVKLDRNDELGVLARAFNAMTAELKSLYAGLEEKVAARTKDLEQANAQVIRRALQLQTSSEVAQAASSILDVNRLLDRVVNLVRERFGFYHVQVFLLSPDERWAELRASTGEVGRLMLARKHRLEIGSHSLIGFVTDRRRAHVAMDVGSDEFHRFNPLLPETRAELAIPLVVGDHLLGALDVQSTDVNAFTSEDIALFESLSAQISVAIENARLYGSAQALVRRERMLKELGNKIRGTLDIDQILETTARELSRALGATRTVVRVGTGTPAAGAAPALPAETPPPGGAPGDGNGHPSSPSEAPGNPQ